MSLIATLNNAISADVQQQYLNPGASEADIAAFKEAVGPEISEALPASFYDFFSWHNGSSSNEWTQQPFYDHNAILSLSGIASSWAMWRDIAADGAFKEWVENAWWDPAWVPFINSDWYVEVIDTKGSFGGIPGQILGFDFKAVVDRCISYASFDDWIKTVTAVAHAGLLRPGFPTDEEQMQDIDKFTMEEEAQIRQIQGECNPGYPWTNDMTEYRASAQGTPNPHWSSLEAAMINGDLGTVQTLINTGDIGISEQFPHAEENETPTHMAIRYKKWDIVLWLIQQAPDLTIKDAYGFVPLDRMICDYHRSDNAPYLGDIFCPILSAARDTGFTLNVTYVAFNAIAQHDDALLRFALNNGCPHDATERWNRTPLPHETAKQGWYEGLMILEAAGVDIQMENGDGQTLYTYLKDHCANTIKIAIEKAGQGYQGREMEQTRRWFSFYRASERLTEFPYLDEYMELINES